MQLYRDGKSWDDFKKELGANFTLKAHVDFELSDSYSGFQLIDDKWVKMFPKYLGLPVEYTYVDKQNNACHIRYVVSRGDNMHQGSGNKTLILTPNVIEFVNGRVRCDANNLALYFFLINHPDSASNSRYEGEKGKQLLLTRGRPLVFREINREKDLEANSAKKDLIVEIQYILSKKTPEKDLREVYSFYGQPNSQTVDQRTIKLYLLDQASKEPEKMQKTLNDTGRSVGALVNEAINLKKIEYKKQDRFWKYIDSTESICSVPQGVNSTDYLVQWLKENDTDGAVQSIIKQMIATGVGSLEAAAAA